MSKYTPEVGDVWKDPCGQEVYIGSLGQQNVYLNWSDVKDICTKKVSEAYKQTKRENTKLKTDCHTLAQKLLQVKPELRDWLEVNYGEYL